ncbi:hypothetical protein [Dyella silvae]|nr:hypothetical protein [Dyella silvae]
MCDTSIARLGDVDVVQLQLCVVDAVALSFVACAAIGGTMAANAKAS